MQGKDQTFTFDRETHQFKVGGIVWPSITQVLVSTGFINTKWFDDYSATRGTYVHKIVELDIKGILDKSSIDPALQGYYDAWLKFRNEKKYDIKETEKPRINFMYKFGGIADTFGTMDGKPVVIDIKTGIEQPATRLQTAAQTLLVDWPVLERFSLQLKSDGNYKLNAYPIRENAADRNIFLAALSCHWWKRNHNIK